MVGTMTETHAKSASDVEQSRSDAETQSRIASATATAPDPSKVKVKSEKVDAEVEAKLKALSARERASRSKSHEKEASDSEGDPGEDKKGIAPVKSSNEILAELFGVFNAAPPEELLDDKNLLKKHKKEKKEKKKRDKEKSKTKKLARLTDGEYSEAEIEGKKHKHKRKKHKHKDIKDKDKLKDGERTKEKQLMEVLKESLPVIVKEKEKEKEKEKSQIRKRHTETGNASDQVPAVKRERLDKERERERERDRSHNSFYNGQRETVRSRGVSKSKNRPDHDQSDVSLSDEESFLREKASNGHGRGRRPAHNSFYGEPKENQRSHVHHTNSNHRRRRTRSRSRSRELGIDKKRLLEIARKNAISMFKRGNMPGVDNMTPEVKDKVLLKMRYGGRTVQDLTEFCKKISNGDNLSDLSSEEDSDVDKNGNAKAFHHPFQIKEREPIVMHIRNSTPLVPSTAAQREEQTKAITMQFPVSSGQVHRMNEVWVPVETKDSSLAPLPALPPAKQATNLFKDNQKNVFAKSIPQQEQQKPAFKPIPSSHEMVESLTDVPNDFVVPSKPGPDPVPPPAPVIKPIAPVVIQKFVPEVPIPSARTNDNPLPPPAPPTPKAPPTPANTSIFPVTAPPSMDVSSIITQRLSAIRRLQDNPADSEAIKMMYNAQRDMSSWASSKHLPGQFTGSTGAQVMKVHELNSGPQLWARRDQLTATKPVTGGMGMALMAKMGWKPGEGLGRSKSGSLQPLLLDVKLDKRGLVSREDIKQAPPQQQQRKNKANPMVGSGNPAASTGPTVSQNNQDKHPVCVLNELTSKNKWTPPQYVLQQNTGPAHMRTFLFSVEINGQIYTPSIGCNSKKEAKLNAAKLCLRALGLLPPS
ncbi:protein Son [Drosophila tropicalis]|uniref:protein Son n=1 Tax=Drosophila tropicalis TaxID=46794 RepID=UPI0035AB9760